MLAKVIIENGVKKIQALTADTGTGAPVGSYLYLEKKSNPQGYLYCDGSTFDETVYPALYQYLGTNVLPDWREFSAVGAEQNTTNVYDAQTNPNGVIHDHDVYTEGQAKDDQLQDHEHEGKVSEGAGGSNVSKIIGTSGTPYGGSGLVLESYRHGTVTRGKSRAVFIYIKATSGLTENQQENVLNTINENNSYSTEEHPTGKKWIDGKPTYEKVIPFTLNAYTDQNNWRVFNGSIDTSSLNIDTYIKQENTIIWSATTSGHTGRILNLESQINVNGNIATGGSVTIDNNSLDLQTSQNVNIYVITEITGNIIIEYTKTTD